MRKRDIVSRYRIKTIKIMTNVEKLKKLCESEGENFAEEMEYTGIDLLMEREIEDNANELEDAKTLIEAEIEDTIKKQEAETKLHLSMTQQEEINKNTEDLIKQIHKH